MSNEIRDSAVDRPRTLHDELPAPGGFDLTYVLSSMFRMAGQILGGVLLLIGVYYALVVLGQILAAGANPANLGPALERMETLLKLEDAKLVIDNTEIPLGRTAAFGALCMWYLLSFWIPLGLIGAGTRFIWGPMAERKAFYNALEEFFRNARQTKR